MAKAAAAAAGKTPTLAITLYAISTSHPSEHSDAADSGLLTEVSQTAEVDVTAVSASYANEGKRRSTSGLRMSLVRGFVVKYAP